MPSSEGLERFIALVEAGAHVEAIEAFYAEHASMQENEDPPRVGKALLIETERRALAGTASVQSQCLRPVFVAGERVVIRWRFGFTGHDGRRRTLDELAYQRWEGEQIVEEKFFYDPAQFKPSAT